MDTAPQRQQNKSWVTEPTRHGASIPGARTATMGRRCRRRQHQERRVEADGTLYEAGISGTQKERAAPLRLPPWWWQQPRQGKGGEPRGGRLGPRAFWGLTDSTHLASLAPNSQGVASPTNGGNQGGRSDATTDRMMGEVGRIPPPTEMKTGRVSTGSGGVRTGPPPTHN